MCPSVHAHYGPLIEHVAVAVVGEGPVVARPIAVALPSEPWLDAWIPVSVYLAAANVVPLAVFGADLRTRGANERGHGKDEQEPHRVL